MPPRIGEGPSGTRKPKPVPRRAITAAPPRNADTGDRARARPAPARPTFKRPPLATRPFQAQQEQAQQQVNTARRALPAPPLAQPPIIGEAGRPAAKPRATEPAMSRAEVATFLRSQSEGAQHAREQIVKSIRQQVGNVHGQERVEAVGRLMDEITTDPRLAPVRRVIRHINTVEAANARPSSGAEAKPGRPDRKAGIGFASINLTAASQAGQAVAEKALPGLMANDSLGKITRNALSDIAHLPIMVPQTMYEFSAAGYEAANGDPTRAKELVKGLLDGVYGNLITGDVDGAVEYFREHPIFAALEVRGGKGVAGRGAGAAMRSGKFGARAQQIASTERADIALSGSGARVADRQHYSPDVFTKLFQVALERSNITRPLKDHRLRRRADFESDMAAGTSRAVRADEAGQAADAKPKGPLDAVVGLAVQGVIRPATLKDDLVKEAARLDAVIAHHEAEVKAGREGVFSTGAQKRQNRATADAIQKVLTSPQAMARIGEIAQSGRANVRAINDLEGQAQRLNAGVPERMERAALFPAAQAHIPGAEYSDAPFRAARAREVQAGRDLRAESTRLRQRVEQARKTEQQAQERVKVLAQKHKSERAKEGHNKAIAVYIVNGARFDLRQDAVNAAKAAGIPAKNIQRISLTSADAKRVGELSAARRAVQGAAGHRRAAEADLRALNKRGAAAVPARAAFEGARRERKAAAIGGTHSLNVAGRRVSNDEIRREAGLTEPVAFLPHHTRDRGARAYYQTQFAGRKTADSGEKRTGAAFEKGAVDHSYDAVAEHRIRMRGVVNRIAEHDRIIHSIAVTLPKTPDNPHGMMTWDRAEKMASNAADKGVKLVPYRAVPGSYDRGRMDKILSSQNAAEIPDLAEMIGHEFAERLKAPAANDRSTPNVVLVPRQMINQLKEQQAVSSSVGAVGNVAADTFRRVVLPFSTKWLMGNLLEAGVRLTAVGAGPNAWRIGKNFLKELEKLDHEQALRVKAALTGGLLFGNRGLTVRRFHEHFEDTAFEKPSAAIGTAARLPVVKQLGGLMRRYTDGVFAFNRMIEANAQIAALGKHAKRDMQEMTGSWGKATRAQEKVLQDLAKGYTGKDASKNIHDAARYIDQTLGQYSRFSPRMRRFIQQAAPFLPWYLNAARFVLWTLPAKHPIKTGIFALVAANLQEDFDAQHKGLPPGDLRGEIVLDDGTVLPMARYSPFSLFGTIAGGGDEQLTALVDPLFPQFKSAGLAAFGMNFSGRPAKIDPKDRGPDGRGVPIEVRSTMVFNSLLEAFVPVLSIGKRVREGGSTGYDNSTVLGPKTKPGTKEEVAELLGSKSANRIINPFRTVSGIKGNPRDGSRPTATPTPTAAPAPRSPEDELWDNLDQSREDAQAEQAAQEELWENLYGGG